MNQDVSKTTMMVNLVWSELNMIEVMTDKTYDDLFKNKFILLVDTHLHECEEYEKFKNDQILRRDELMKLYTNPKDNYMVNQEVCGFDTGFHAFHYPPLNQYLTQGGAANRYLFASSDRLTNAKMVWNEYETIAAAILKNNNADDGWTTFYSMCVLQEITTAGDFSGRIAKFFNANSLMTLCATTEMHFLAYNEDIDSCEMILSNSAASYKNSFRCRPDIPISPELRQKILKAIDVFCIRRCFYYNAIDGVPRATKNRYKVKLLPMDQRIDASQHEETLKWDLQFGAKNSPQAINLLLNSSASKRGITKAGASNSNSNSSSSSVNSSDLVHKTLYESEKKKRETLENTLKLKQDELKQKTQELANFKKTSNRHIETPTLKATKTKLVEQVEINESLHNKIKNLQKKLENTIKKANNTSSNAASDCNYIENSNYSSNSNNNSCSYNNSYSSNIEKAEARKKVEELNLQTAALRSKTDSLNSLNTQKQLLLKEQELVIERSKLRNLQDDEEQSRKRRLDEVSNRDEIAMQQRSRLWRHHDEDRTEIMLNNQLSRQIAILNAEGNTNKSLIKASNEHRMMHSLVSSSEYTHLNVPACAAMISSYSTERHASLSESANINNALSSTTQKSANSTNSYNSSWSIETPQTTTSKFQQQSSNSSNSTSVTSSLETPQTKFQQQSTSTSNNKKTSICLETSQSQLSQQLSSNDNCFSTSVDMETDCDEEDIEKERKELERQILEIQAQIDAQAD